MAHWHETAKQKGNWVFPNRESRVAALFEGEDVRRSPFEGHFLRWEGKGDAPIMGWRRDPDGWVELRPHQALLASSRDEAKDKITPLLPQIESGRIDVQFDVRPYRPPARPQLIEEIEHPSHQAKARIVQHLEGHYEALYLVYAPDGKYFPAVTPSIGELGWEWGRARLGTRTLADDLADAEKIAQEELAQVVAADPEIKQR